MDFVTRLPSRQLPIEMARSLLSGAKFTLGEIPGWSGFKRTLKTRRKPRWSESTRAVNKNIGWRERDSARAGQVKSDVDHVICDDPKTHPTFDAWNALVE